MRDKELKHLYYSLIWRRFSITVQFVLPTLISFATLATYVALGNTLKLETVVITLSFINGRALASVVSNKLPIHDLQSRSCVLSHSFTISDAFDPPRDLACCRSTCVDQAD